MKIIKTQLKGVYSRKLSGKQMVEFLEFIQELKEKELTPSKVNLEVAGLLISMGACDKEGKPLYTPEEAKELDHDEFQYLMTKVTDINKMGETSNQKKAISEKS